MNRIAIIGAGVLGQHIAHYLLQTNTIQLAGFYDDTYPKGELINGIPILNNLDNILLEFHKNKFDKLLIGIGYNHLERRQAIFNRFHLEIPFANFIHPSCIVDHSVKLGTGIIALPGCIFDKNAQLHDNILFNIGCNIAHDTLVGAHSFLGPSVNVAGFVKIGQRCFLGINTTIIDNITIGDHIQTGAGAVVTKNLIENGLYIGTPAKYFRPI